MIEIELTDDEMQVAVWVGAMRRVGAIRKGLQYRNGPPQYPGQEWAIDIVGAAGELACAKYLGLYWHGLSPLARGCDVAGNVDVRSSLRDDAPLIVRDRDADDRPFVLVTGRPPLLTLRGWLVARDGKRPEYRNPTPPPYFEVPQARLSAIEHLRTWLL